MSELKATTAYDAYWKANSVGEGTGVLVYLKSEADKVIAEKDEKIDELKDKLLNVSELITETREWLIESQKMHKRCADNAIKQICHHKFKRCLAMANWCGSKVYHIRRTPLSDMSEHEYWQYENDFWQRWQKRWLELAERFKDKEAK